MATYNPNKPVFRSVSAYRSSIPAIPKPDLVDVERDSVLEPAQDVPPEMPYKLSFASQNTFKSVEKSASEVKVSAVEVLEQLKVDVLFSSGWELQCEMYPNETKTPFLVKIFSDEDGSRKQSCLVELQLVDGDHFAFQYMCRYFQKYMALEDAHKGFDDFGFGFESQFDQALPDTYEHAEWKPLPLPSTLPRSVSSDDLSLFAPVELDEAEIVPVVAVLAENTLSDFADVRRDGWRELAKVTGEEAMASALLDVTVAGTNAIDFAVGTFVSLEVHDELTEDHRRCVMKTLLNLCGVKRDSSLGTNERLRAKILSVAKDIRNTYECRSIALQLLQKVETPSSDKEYRMTLETCSVETGRVGKCAIQALNSLAVC